MDDGAPWKRVNGQRLAADDGSLPRSQRNAQGLFGMVSLTGEQRWGAFHVAPFLRFETAFAQFGTASERGSAFSALTFDAMNTTSAAGVAGLRLGYVFAQDWGRVEPRLRVEYRYQFSGSYSQAMTYADLAGGPSYLLQGPAQSRQELTTMLGLAVDTNDLLSVQLEYGFSMPLTGGASGITGQTLRATLRKGF